METLEALGYFTFFWLFLFSARFRSAQLEEWREGGLPERLMLIYEATVSLLLGLVIPAWLVVLAARSGT